MSHLSEEALAARLFEALIFEQWVRFSWISEDEEGDFCIQIPPDTFQELLKTYPDFKLLLERLNGTIVDAGMACSAILGFAQERLGSESLKVLEQTAFQNRVERFHVWLHEQAEQLSKTSFTFEQWKTMVEEGQKQVAASQKESR